MSASVEGYVPHNIAAHPVLFIDTELLTILLYVYIINIIFDIRVNLLILVRSEQKRQS